MLQKKPRKIARKSNEHLLQCAFFQWLHYEFPDVARMTFAIPNGGDRNIIVAAKLKREGVKKGVADVFIAHPNKIYCGLFIEFKTGKNKLTIEQKEFLMLATENNYKAIVCYDLESAINDVREYLHDYQRQPT